VKVALVRLVCPVSTKSSADSISNFPADSGRVAVAILASGFPVLKKNGSAHAAPAISIVAATIQKQG
jgi:hypothetical protein